MKKRLERKDKVNEWYFDKSKNREYIICTIWKCHKSKYRTEMGVCTIYLFDNTINLGENIVSTSW